MFLTEDEHLMG